MPQPFPPRATAKPSRLRTLAAFALVAGATFSVIHVPSRGAPPVTRRAAEAGAAEGGRERQTPAGVLKDFERTPSLENARRLADAGNEEAIPDAVPRVAAMMKSPDRSVRCNAGLVLARLGDDRGLAAVVAELNDAAPRPAPGRTRSDGKPDFSGQVRQDRYYAAHVLGEMRDKRAVPALVATFDNPDLAYKAAYSLGQIGDAAAVAPLRRLMGESAGDTRLAAAHALAKLGAPDGLPVVAGFLGDKEWTVRRRAAESLAELKDRKGVPALLGALKDADVNVRVAAARALGEIADPAALTALAALDGDEQTTTAGPPVSVRQAARDAADRINKASLRSGG